MASPNFKINGNPVGVPASVGASSTVTATLDSTDGVRQVEWSIASTDETTAIGDYTLVTSGSIGQTVTTTSLTAGTAARLRCRINGGVNLSTGLNDPNGTNAYGKFYVATAAGYAVGCVGETTEQDATSGWTSIVNPIIRVTPAAAPVASVSGTAPIVSSGGATPAISITAASGGNAGSMSAAHYTKVQALALPFTLGAFTQPALNATVSGVTYTGTALPAGVSIIAVIGTSIVGYYTISASAGTVSLTLDTISAYAPTASVPAGAVVYTTPSQASRILYGGTNDWDGTPAEVATALDRLAAAVTSLLAGPIP